MKLMPVVYEFPTDIILDNLSELAWEDVWACSLAACNIMVKCRASLWWAICAMHGSNMKSSFICLHIKMYTEYCKV